MLRIHFTRQDLNKTTIAARPDTLWELVLSLQRLQSKYPEGPGGPPAPSEVGEWRTNTLSHLGGRALGRRVRDHLLPLTPFTTYFPDFLTPYDGLLGLDHGLDTLQSTPRQRLGRELGRLATRPTDLSWGQELVAGKTSALRLLGGTMQDYFATALGPRWPAIRTRIATEHTRLAGIQTRNGTEAMLSSMRPFGRWHPGDRILETRYPVGLNIHLRGRGLTLIPSWFCCGSPVALADPALPPVLVYPLTHDPLPPAAPHALAKLVGATRAKILTTITTGTPTSTILRRTGISAAQLSRHAAVLRDNNLITEARHAGHTYYTRTPLGRALGGS